MDYSQLYAQLNPYQQRAVDTLDGPVMVLAGPGTGKTQLLSARTANILKNTDLYPSNILILTYTNAGVKAMRERLAEIMGLDGYDVVVETFHSFANNLITNSDEAASVKGNRIEMTDLERINLLEYLLDHTPGMKPIRHPNAPYLYRRDIQTNISNLKRDGITPEEVETFLKSYQPDGILVEEKHLNRLRAFSKLYSAYEEAKTPEGHVPVVDQRGRYDFDDMIMLATQALLQEPELLAEQREQFQHVMVDEFQDTNGAQLKLLKTLFQEARSNICVVGDDDQSIYRFQGASVGNFKIFSELYSDVIPITLHENYRSPDPILKKSAQIIGQIPLEERVQEKVLTAVREEKTDTGVNSHRFGTLEEELTFLVQEMKGLTKKQWNDTAVFVRTRRQAEDIIEAFLQAGIPYSTDGKEDIRGEFRIQQLLKVLKLARGSLDFEQKDLLLFEILLGDFWELDHHDLMTFISYFHRKKRKNLRHDKRQQNKSPKAYRLEESHYGMELDFAEEAPAEEVPTSLFEEFLLRFPLPHRPPQRDHDRPTEEETASLTICRELSFRKPNLLHRAAWVIHRLTTRSAQYPVYPLLMDFIRDAGLVDFILHFYEDNRVVQLRELRSVASFVENLKKASKAKPGIMIEQYVEDLDQLEKHEIPFAGEMVSSAQEGVKILTAHGSKGLEFENVFIPFCIQDKAWPKREQTNKIPLPHQLLIGQELIHEKEQEKKLHEWDECRLFYVAATRAKNRLIFSAAPQDKQMMSQFLKQIGLAPEQRTEIPEEKTLIQLIKHSPRPDPVALTKDTLKGLVEELTLSPSSLNTYLSCPRRFLYHHLLKTPQPKTQALVYGQCIHKALEKSYRRYMNEGFFPPLSYFEEQFLQELHWQGVEQVIRQGCLDKLEDAKEWYRQTIESGPAKPLELERRLTRKLPEGLIFRGQFDKVERLGNSEEVQVVDYKTGEPDKHIKAIDKCDKLGSEDCDDYLRQLVAYKLLYEGGHRSLRVKRGQLVFLDPVKSTVKKYGLEKGKFVNKVIPLTQDMVQSYEKLIQETWRKIQALEFDRLPEYDPDKCGYCPYKGVCWK